MDRFFNPFRELEALRRGIDQVFADAWPGSLCRGSLFLPGRSARGYPLINLSGDPEKYVVESLAPGLDLGSLDVPVQGNTLTISGEKKSIPDVSWYQYGHCVAQRRIPGHWFRRTQQHG
jgi:HSP20 family molecular chaperone IbpA